MPDNDFQHYRAEMLAAIKASEDRILGKFTELFRRLYGSDDRTTGDVNLMDFRIRNIEGWRSGWGGVAQLLALFGGASGIILLGITLAKAIAK